MKKVIILNFLLVYGLLCNSQSIAYDHIRRDEYSIVKNVSQSNTPAALKAKSIINRNDAEKQFGKNFKSKKVLTEMSREYYDNLTFDDGLVLEIPENHKMDLKFRISSSKYSLVLNNGVMVKVGMNSADLASIFPNSYAKRKMITNIKNKNGKSSFAVYFSRLIDNKVVIEDAWITFIINKNEELEEFYTYEPQ